MEFALTKISKNGQVVIPAEVRNDAKIKPSTKFLVFNQKGTIVLKRIDKKEILDEIELVQRVQRIEKEIAQGKYVEADTEMSAEEIDKLLMS